MKHFRVTDPLCGEFTDEFSSQRPVTRNFDVFFDLRLTKRLSKQSRRRWFETQWRSLWHHCNMYNHPLYVHTQHLMTHNHRFAKKKSIFLPSTTNVLFWIDRYKTWTRHRLKCKALISNYITQHNVDSNCLSLPWFSLVVQGKTIQTPTMKCKTTILCMQLDLTIFVWDLKRGSQSRLPSRLTVPQWLVPDSDVLANNIRRKFGLVNGAHRLGRLTHWGRDKMAAIFETTFSIVISWITLHEFRWILFLRFELTISQHWLK